MRAGYGLRAARAVVFTVLSVLLSAGGRLVVTGRPLPLTTLLVAGAAVFLLALLLTGAERRFLQIAAMLVPAELALNALFNTVQERCAVAVPGAGSGGWPGLLVCGGGSVRPGLLGAAAVSPSHSLAALAAGQVLVLLALHTVVALVMAAWLRRGEAAVFVVLRAAAALSWTGLTVLWALLTAATPDPLPPAWRVPPLERPCPGPRHVLRRTSTRRGPPVLAPAC
ncbi:hypothetical protein [Actinoallomurus iriomotensis]|uniref:Uncharacterized protein n=1 Tax=Actinoallomurus iriomotensis TaxID=478107 RepID=A0A9W6VP35_9ACTN|nr:hypothetical protein [Actinoallomurus iriomotensis]GLY74409.1 hypothetical protein Airi01_026760 [Actinoallomurus iriomotensis]